MTSGLSVHIMSTISAPFLAQTNSKLAWVKFTLNIRIRSNRQDFRYLGERFISFANNHKQDITVSYYNKLIKLSY